MDLVTLNADVMNEDKLVAKFMNLHVAMHGTVLYLSDEDGYIDFTGDAQPYRPGKSWNQLMPVVEKIQRILSKPGASDMAGWDHWNNQFDGTINTDIRVAYQIVVEFIKWYNSKKQ